jgi:hypothetical protein
MAKQWRREWSVAAKLSERATGLPAVDRGTPGSAAGSRPIADSAAGAVARTLAGTHCRDKKVEGGTVRFILLAALGARS